MPKIVSKIKAVLRSPVFWGVAGIVVAAMFDARKVNMSFLLGALFLILVFEFSTSETISQLRLLHRAASTVVCAAVLGFALWLLRGWLARTPQDADTTPSLLPDIAGHTLAIGTLVLTILIILLVQRRRYRVLEKALSDRLAGLRDVKGQLEVLQIYRKLHAEKNQECPDGWLHDIANADKKRIVERVSIECVLGDRCLDLDVPYIVFGFRIRNNSVFDITVDNEITGHIVFREMALKGRIDLLNYGAEDIHYREWGHVTLKLLLSLEEAKHISKSANDIDANFYFRDLILTIKGGRRFQEITPMRLPTDTAAIHISGDLPNVWATKVEQAKLNCQKCQKLADKIKDLSHVVGEGVQLAYEIRTWEGREPVTHAIEVFQVHLERTVEQWLGHDSLIKFRMDVLQRLVMTDPLPATREQELREEIEMDGAVQNSLLIPAHPKSSANGCRCTAINYGSL
jgi:hypothetical protein